MISKNSSSGGSGKVGFAFYLFNLLVVGGIFFTYLWRSPQSDYMEVGDWCFYALASFTHAAMVSLVAYLPALLVQWLTRSSRAAGIMQVTLSSLLVMLALLNGEVYAIYKFHINGFVLGMVFGEAAGEIFTFDTWLYIKAIGMMLAVIAGNIGVWALIRHYAPRMARLRYLPAVALLIGSTVCAHLYHAYAAAAQKPAVIRSAMHLPYYYPLTANRFMLKTGLVTAEEFVSVDFKTASSALDYPHHPIGCDTLSASASADTTAKNVVLIVVDSWNHRTLTPEIMPNTCRFAQEECIQYTAHLSSSNGTRGSIFGIFFSMPALYWRDCEILGTQPVLVEEMLRQGYRIGIYPSASIVDPPFAKVMFAKVPNARNHTPGSTVLERDTRITDDFIASLDSLSSPRPDGSRKPFFSFLFYDLPHSFQLPKERLTHFQPSWEYADYTKLSNELDPTPFFNLYKNCLYETDLLIGRVIDALREKGMLENTLIVITGDHGQEFNENRKNYWGHGSNFSPIQLRVPFMVHRPGVAPAVKHHRTTHYDFAPTVMREVLNVANPISDYGVGHLLDDSCPRSWHVVGDYMDYGFILDDHTIIEKQASGLMEITDSLLRPIKDYKLDVKRLNDAVLSINQFYKQ